MSYFTSRDEWLFGDKCKNPLEDRDYLVKNEVMRMLNKTIKIFKYKNLPDTIKPKDLEIQLQMFGYSIFKEVKDELYCFWGSLGGEPNPYYLPTLAIITNPALRYNATLKIEESCEVVLNDFLYQGLKPLHLKYANLLVDAELSLKFAILNARIPSLAEADNDATYESANEFFEKVKKGEQFGAIATREFFDGLKTHDFIRDTHITSIIESIQYIRGSWYNEIGLNAQFNMKREAINEAEASMNEDILYPSIDTMLECRKQGIERVNKMFGTNIEVELDSSWNDIRKEQKLAEDIKKAEIEEISKGEEDETERQTNEPE